VARGLADVFAHPECFQEGAHMFAWFKGQDKDMHSGQGKGTQSMPAHSADGVPGLSLIRGANVFAPAHCGLQDLLLSSAGIVQLGPDKLGPAEALVSPVNIIDATGCIAVPGIPILRRAELAPLRSSAIVAWQVLTRLMPAQGWWTCTFTYAAGAAKQARRE